MSNNTEPALDDFGANVPFSGHHTMPPAQIRDRHKPLMVVYIAGDGRSGSTLLDRLIGVYPNVFSCGELGNLLQSTASSEQFCACGAQARDCGFWVQVLQRWSASVPDFTEREYRSLQRRFERLRQLLRPGFRRELNVENPRFARYAEYTRSLFDAIADLSGAEVIVDSSKSPARALALSRVPGIEVRMLHLVRDVRGVAYSLRKLQKPKPGEGLLVKLRRRSNLRFAGTWAVVNYFCEKVRPIIPGPSMFTRYEDYTADLDGTLTTLAGLIGRDRLSYAASAENLMKQGHQVAGNDARLRPVQAISTDEVWRRQFGFTLRKGLYVLVLPLMLRYRYRP